jgi:hypothetical protein
LPRLVSAKRADLMLTRFFSVSAASPRRLAA